MKKHIKTNLYAAVDVMAIVTVLLLAAFVAEKKKGMLIGAASTTILGSGLLIAQALFGKAKVENCCPEIVYTKSEDGCDATELEPGLERYDIDGVKSCGVVYKLSDGVHGVIKKDGTLKVKSLTGKFINSVRGGKLSMAPDDCWKELFKA